MSKYIGAIHKARHGQGEGGVLRKLQFVTGKGCKAPTQRKSKNNWQPLIRVQHLCFVHTVDGHFLFHPADPIKLAYGELSEYRNPLRERVFSNFYVS